MNKPVYCQKSRGHFRSAQSLALPGPMNRAGHVMTFSRLPLAPRFVVTPWWAALGIAGAVFLTGPVATIFEHEAAPVAYTASHLGFIAMPLAAIGLFISSCSTSAGKGQRK